MLTYTRRYDMHKNDSEFYWAVKSQQCFKHLARFHIVKTLLNTNYHVPINNGIPLKTAYRIPEKFD